MSFDYNCKLNLSAKVTLVAFLGNVYKWALIYYFPLPFYAPSRLILILAYHLATTLKVPSSLQLTFQCNVICPACFLVVCDSTWLQSDGIRTSRAWRLAPLSRGIISLRPLGAALLFSHVMLLIQT